MTATLTPRRMAVVRLWALGTPLRAIEETLGLKHGSCKRYLQEAQEQLDTDSPQGVLAKLGWLRVPEEMRTPDVAVDRADDGTSVQSAPASSRRTAA